MEIKRSDLFFCYDVLLHRKLKKANIEYLVSALSNHERRFWLYPLSDRVKSVIEIHKQEQV